MPRSMAAALAALLMLMGVVAAAAPNATTMTEAASAAVLVAAPAPSSALTPAQATVANLPIASRVSAAGEQCRLPVVVNGTLVTDCFAWPGKLPGDGAPTPPAAPTGAVLVAAAVRADPAAGACFTLASPTVPQRCARSGGGAYPRSPLASLLVAGKGADALPGSLCTIGGGRVAAKIISPGAESAKLPSCGEDSGWGCAVLRPKGQLKASGFGFCQALDGSDPTAAGAGAPLGAGTLAAPVEVPGGAASLPTNPPAKAKATTDTADACGPACM